MVGVIKAMTASAVDGAYRSYEIVETLESNGKPTLQRGA